MGPVPVAEDRPTVFPRLELESFLFNWSGWLAAPTPVDLRGGRYYKREDAFAPLGYGGPNGMKLRQLVGLVQDYVSKGGRAGLLTGASVLSPQLSMGTLVARHYGLPTTIVLGGTKPETALRHPNVAIAAAAGAHVRYVPVGYNPALQAEVHRLKGTPEFGGHFVLKYGITNNYPDDARNVAWFHAISADQVRNIPPTVRTLAMTAGSCNSAISVLWGLARHQPRSLERVVFFGIGPNKWPWVEKRLAMIEQASGRVVRGMFSAEWLGEHGAPYKLEYVDLHKSGFATYHDRMPYSLDGIDFHPTYEGKMLTALDRDRDRFAWFWEADRDVLVWVVGSAPEPEVIMPYLRGAAA